jgi:hypothetical protein
VKRHDESLTGEPRQGLVDEHQNGGRRERHRPEQERLVRLKRRGRDHDRAEEQDRERVLQAAGQVEEAGELQEVIGEQQRRPVRVEPPRRREDDPQAEIEPGGERDQGQAGAEGDRELEPEADDEDRRRLAGDREPPQADERGEPKPVPRPAAGFLGPCLQRPIHPAVLAGQRCPVRANQPRGFLRRKRLL